MTTHEEKIKCPECDTEQIAVVQHTVPFYSYVHDCESCGFTIGESDWDRLDYYL